MDENAQKSKIEENFFEQEWKNTKEYRDSISLKDALVCSARDFPRGRPPKPDGDYFRPETPDRAFIRVCIPKMGTVKWPLGISWPGRTYEKFREVRIKYHLEHPTQYSASVYDWQWEAKEKTYKLDDEFQTYLHSSLWKIKTPKLREVGEFVEKHLAMFRE